MSEILSSLFTTHPRLTPCERDILAATGLMATAFASGNKLLLCGNGGSASDADHIAGELLKGFRSKRPVQGETREKLGDTLADKLQGALPAVPFGNFTALNTAYLNDVDGEYAYAQLVLGLGTPGDVLLGISTSGNAKNVCHALRAARALGLKTLGLSGQSGGNMAGLCEVCIRVPETETHRVQELHLPVYHALCLLLEEAFF